MVYDNRFGDREAITKKLHLIVDKPIGLLIRSVADMAAVAGLSSRQLQRVLKPTTGSSPHDLLKVLRLQRSIRQDLLMSYTDQILPGERRLVCFAGTWRRIGRADRHKLVPLMAVAVLQLNRNFIFAISKIHIGIVKPLVRLYTKSK